MRKGLLVSLMSMAAISSSLAGAKHNVYVGLGAANVIGNHNAVINYVINNPLTTRGFLHQFSNSTLAGDILAGYAVNINNLTLSGEVDYLFGNLNRTNFSQFSGNTNSDTQKVESTGGAWGLGLRIGYTCLERVQPYIRLGLESRRFKLTSITSFPGLADFTSLSTSDRKVAFTPGLGMDFKLNKNLALGIEYRYAFYNSIAKTPPAQIVAGAITRTTTFKITPRVSTALISLKYIWG